MRTCLGSFVLFIEDSDCDLDLTGLYILRVNGAFIYLLDCNFYYEVQEGTILDDYAKAFKSILLVPKKTKATVYLLDRPHLCPGVCIIFICDSCGIRARS